jgi:hypothetical protein
VKMGNALGLNKDRKRLREGSVKTPASSGLFRLTHLYSQREQLAITLILCAALGRYIKAESFWVSAFAAVLVGMAVFLYPTVWPGGVLLTWVLPQIVSSGVSNIAISAVLISMLPLMLLQRLRVSGRKKDMVRYYLFGLLILIAIIISHFASRHFSDSGSTIIRVVSVLLFLVSLLLVNTQKEGLIHNIFLSAAAFLLSLKVVLFGFTNLMYDLHNPEFVASVSDPNYISMMILLGLPFLLLSVSSRRSSLLGRLALLILLSIEVAAIIMLSSRMASVIMAAIAVLFIIQLLKTTSILTKALFSVVAISLIVSSFIPKSSIQSYSDRWRNIDEISQFSERWKILGWSFEYLATASMYDLVVGGGAQHNYSVLSGFNAHNSFLEYLIDHGIVGASGLIALLVYMWKRTKYCSQNEKFFRRSVLATLVISSMAISPFVWYWAWLALPSLSAGSISE